MRALICFSLLCCFDAFSLREPVSTSLENAIPCFDAFSLREPVSTSLENAIPCFDAFSSREPVSTSLENAIPCFDAFSSCELHFARKQSFSCQAPSWRTWSCRLSGACRESAVLRSYRTRSPQYWWRGRRSVRCSWRRTSDGCRRRCCADL